MSAHQLVGFVSVIRQATSGVVGPVQARIQDVRLVGLVFARVGFGGGDLGVGHAHAAQQLVGAVRRAVGQCGGFDERLKDDFGRLALTGGELLQAAVGVIGDDDSAAHGGASSYDDVNAR